MTRRAWTMAALLLTGFLLAWQFGGRLFEERSVFLSAARLGEGHAATLVSLTRLGNLVLLGPVSLLLALALCWRRGIVGGAIYLAGTLIGRLSEDALKLAISRPRPALLPHLDRIWGTSFPSAHSFNSTLVFVGFALVWSDRRILGGAIALVAAIGASRVMLAVHWPSDVIGGWCLGGLAALLVARAAAAGRRTRPAS